jgi:D-alanyl-D-alanine carboxypeptidase
VIEETATVEEHVFQQKHKMLLDGYQAYYEDAIGGKTGYTSDALSTLITMADNGEMELVCVVLRTYGRNIYPDTTALFEYGFNKFKKISVDGLETCEDVGDILTDQDGGYVVLPKNVKFEDLEMELVPDDANNGEATLIYTYRDTPVGSARAKLSDSYIKEHSIQIEVEESGEEKLEDDKKVQEGGLSKKAKIVVGALGFVLIVLIGFFVRASIIRNRRRRRRIQRHAQMRQNEKRIE